VVLNYRMRLADDVEVIDIYYGATSAS